MRFNTEEERFLKDNEIGRLATVCQDGLPHVIPVCYIYRSGCLWIATDYETRKYQNLLSNNKVALIVDAGYDSNRGILVQGRARIYERGPSSARPTPLSTRSSIGLEPLRGRRERFHSSRSSRVARHAGDLG
jgi:pyridoxine/pyridoxamine 5'-phosphate oxidase